MKANIPNRPVRQTYVKHGRGLRWRSYAPVVVSLILCFACSGLVYVATFGYGGDVTLWAEISEIWLAIPTIIIMVVIFAIIGGLIFLLTKLLKILLGTLSWHRISHIR